MIVPGCTRRGGPWLAALCLLRSLAARVIRNPGVSQFRLIGPWRSLAARVKHPSCGLVRAVWRVAPLSLVLADPGSGCSSLARITHGP